MKNVNVANITTNFNGVISKWINFTHPFHKLTKQEQETLTALLIYYFKFKETLDDEDIIWKMVFDYETKLEIQNMLGAKDYTLQNTFSKLRKRNILKNNKVIKSYIPNIEKDSKNFKIVYNFTIKND